MSSSDEQSSPTTKKRKLIPEEYELKRLQLLLKIKKEKTKRLELKIKSKLFDDSIGVATHLYAVIYNSEKQKNNINIDNEVNWIQACDINDNDLLGYFNNIDINTISKESRLQKVMDSLLIKMSNNELKCIDTHSKAYLSVQLDSNTPQLPDFTFYFKNYNLSMDFNYSLLTKIANIVGEIKAPNVNINTPSCLGQVVSYLQTLSTSQKNYRKYHYGFLTNYTSIIFCKSEITNDNNNNRVLIRHSELIDFTPTNNNVTLGMKVLYSLINSSMDKIDPLGFYAIKPITLESFIGNGFTSLVFETSNKKVAKISKTIDFTDTIDYEYKVLDTFKNVNNIPKVEKHSSGILIMERYFPVTNQYTQLTIPTKEECIDLINLLEKIHLMGYCHRDIRPDNIMKTQEGKLIFIDWGFACKVNEKPFFAGTLSFCADEYLGCLLNPYNIIINKSYKSVYDCEALLKTFCFWFGENKIRFSSTDQKEKANASRQFWSNFKELHFKNFISQLYTQNPYNALKDFLQINGL